MLFNMFAIATMALFLVCTSARDIIGVTKIGKDSFSSLCSFVELGGFKRILLLPSEEYPCALTETDPFNRLKDSIECLNDDVDIDIHQEYLYFDAKLLFIRQDASLLLPKSSENFAYVYPDPTEGKALLILGGSLRQVLDILQENEHDEAPRKTLPYPIGNRESLNLVESASETETEKNLPNPVFVHVEQTTDPFYWISTFRGEPVPVSHTCKL